MKRILAALLLVCCLLTACGQKPAAPETLSATLENGAAVIRWSQSDEAETYRLYRRSPKDADFKFIFDSAGSETSYSDRFVSDGGTYLYKLEIIGKNGVSTEQECTLNVPGSKSAEEVKAPETPVITSVTAKDKYTVVVSVKPQENCTYEFLRASSRDGDYQPVATRDEPFLYDANEDKKTDWFYRVRAVRGELRSELSAPQNAAGRPAVGGPPTTIVSGFVERCVSRSSGTCARRPKRSRPSRTETISGIVMRTAGIVTVPGVIVR